MPDLEVTILRGFRALEYDDLCLAIWKRELICLAINKYGMRMRESNLKREYSNNLYIQFRSNISILYHSCKNT